MPQKIPHSGQMPLKFEKNPKYHWTQERMPKKIPRPGFSMGEDLKIVPTLKRY